MAEPIPFERRQLATDVDLGDSTTAGDLARSPPFLQRENLAERLAKLEAL
jgi:hypothetical protein